jgi:hypothetical protein
MIITLTPDDIIRRGLWSDYKKFVLKDLSEDQIINIVKENKLITITENDAYVVGLLKVIETENLVHRFNINIQDLLQIKSNIFDEGIYINKNLIYREISNYKLRFPEYWDCDFTYKQSRTALFEYIDKILLKLNDIESFIYTSKDKPYEFLDVKQITKILDL